MDVSAIGPLINTEARPAQGSSPVKALPKLPDLPAMAGFDQQLTAARAASAASAPGAASPTSFFADLLDRVVTSDASAQKAVDAYSTGASQNLHETMVKLGKADINFSLMVSVRNKLLNAYREIMKM